MTTLEDTEETSMPPAVITCAGGVRLQLGAGPGAHDKEGARDGE